MSKDERRQKEAEYELGLEGSQSSHGKPAHTRPLESSPDADGIGLLVLQRPDGRSSAPLSATGSQNSLDVPSPQQGFSLALSKTLTHSRFAFFTFRGSVNLSIQIGWELATFLPQPSVY